MPNEEIVQAKYKCSQPVFYTVSQMILEATKARIARFTAFSPAYTSAWVDDQLTALEAARDLKDNQARGAVSEKLNADLFAAAAECRLQWQMLRRYIEKPNAFPPAHVKATLEEAGWLHYDAAGRNDWEKVTSLMNAGRTFLLDANNITALTANNNMPAGFPAQYNAAFTPFKALHIQFLQATQSSGLGTVSKIVANNAVYDVVIDICKDAPLIFAKEAVTLKEYTWSTVQSIVDAQINSSTLTFEGTIDPENRVSLNVTGIQPTGTVEVTLINGFAAEVVVWLDIDDPSFATDTSASVSGPDPKLFPYQNILKSGVTTPVRLKLQNLSTTETVTFQAIVKLS